MEDKEFDTALVSAAFAQAGLTGWRGLSIVDAARSAGLPLDRARERFPSPAAVLMRFGTIADTAVLAEPLTENDPRADLFDLLMRRYDVLQQHRDGMLALLRVLPSDPLLALALTSATGRSMRWMLDAAGIPTTGLRGALRAQGLIGVWLYTLRAWKNDESADLSATMAALDKALDQAVRAEGWLGANRSGADDEPEDDVAAGTVVMADDGQAGGGNERTDPVPAAGLPASVPPLPPDLAPPA